MFMPKYAQFFKLLLVAEYCNQRHCYFAMRKILNRVFNCQWKGQNEVFVGLNQNS